ncbi:MAG: hypothetical protein WAK89_04595 [Candidatus Sulfotelmatobacter sp.]
MGSASALDGGSGICLGPEEGKRTCFSCGAGTTCKRALACRAFARSTFSCSDFAWGGAVTRFDGFAREHGGPWEYDAESWKHGGPREYGAESGEHGGPWEYDAESWKHGGPREYDAESWEHGGPWEFGAESWKHGRGSREYDSRKSRSRRPASGENGIAEGRRPREHPSERVSPLYRPQRDAHSKWGARRTHSCE